VDVVISDILMPRMDGYRLCHEVRTSERWRELPFIFYTATYTSPGDEKLSLDLGADVFLRKPAPTALLLEALQQVTNKARPRRPAPKLGIPATDLMREYNDALVAKLEQKNAEVTAAEIKFRALVEQSLVGIYVIQDDRYAYVNPEMSEIFGYSSEELHGRPALDFVCPEDHELVRGHLLSRLEGAVPTVRYKFRVRRANGEIRQVEVHGSRAEFNDRPAIMGTMLDITERVRADAELRDTHDQLRRLLEHSPVVIYTLKIEGEQVIPQLVSGNMTRLLGFTVAEASSFDWWVAQLHPADLDYAVAGIRATLTGGGLRTEYRIRHKDGRYLWIEDNRRLIRDHEGRAIEIAGVWTDVTERKRVEGERQEADRRFREMLGNVDLIAMTLDLSGTVTFCNDYLVRLTGWTRAEIVGADWFTQFIPAHDTALRKLFFETAAIGEIPAHHENAILTKSGAERTIVWSNTMLRDGAGNPVGTASIGEDITERKQAEGRLRESEERFRQMAENIQEVFWLTIPDKRQMLYVSPAYERIWGRTCESLYASPASWLEAVHPEDRGRVAEASITKQSAGAYDEEYRIVRPDGSVRWVRDRAFPVRNPVGEIVRIVGLARDVTEWRLLETQLRQAQKMEAIGQLAGGIAHDFNNILGAVIGYTELARMATKENPTVAGYLEMVAKASQRAADLVKQILTFSRRNEQQRCVVQLKHIIREALNLLRASVPATIEFKTDLGVVPTVLADPTAVHQLIMNLGANAWHAMRGQPGLLTVELKGVEIDAEFARAHSELRPGRYVRVTVRDTGCGMDRATLERIFEPFFTTKGPGEGTGLGLAVVHGIMKSHDGAIVVESAPGKGTAFHLFFPVHETGVTEVAGELAPLPRGHGEAILFVDDEEPLAQLAKMMLEHVGYSVTIKTRVTDAIDLFRERSGQFDLVITDLAMPVMDGTKFAKELLLIRPGVPIILTTGFSGSLTPEIARELGFRDLLIKPNSPRSLCEAVQRVLGRAKPTL